MRMVKPFFTRSILSVIVGIGLSFFLMFVWYVTQPITVTVMNMSLDFAREVGHNNTYVEQAFTILTFVEYWWGPLLLIGIAVVWLFVSTQREDWRSAED